MGYPVNNKRREPRDMVQSQQLQTLVGERGRNGDDLKAATHDELASLGAITIQSVAITTAPTAADYNKIVADITALAAVLNKAGARFNGL